jgi:ubiquinone/menaquinone biosynthesis C-methylase UbiE
MSTVTTLAHTNDLAPDIHSASDSYASRFKGAIGSWMLEHQAKVTLELLRDEDVHSILEVGGGHGQLTKHFCNAGYAVTVQGSAPECASQIAALIEKQCCTFVVSSMLSLPFADNSFDAVVCIRQLNHLDCWQELLKELSRVSKHVVIVEYPALCSFNCIQTLAFPIKRLLEGNTRRFLVFSASEIEATCTSVGLSSSKRRAQFFLPVGVIRQVKNVKMVRAIEGIFASLGFVQLFGSPVIHKLRKL